jgi:hypothetical protein
MSKACSMDLEVCSATTQACWDVDRIDKDIAMGL